MRIDAEFLVTRLNKEVVDIIPLEDCYQTCDIRLVSENLTDEDIFKFYSNMSKMYQENMLKEVRNTGRLYEQQEAKDLTCKLSQYEINIEKKEVEIN